MGWQQLCDTEQDCTTKAATVEVARRQASHRKPKGTSHITLTLKALLLTLSLQERGLKSYLISSCLGETFNPSRTLLIGSNTLSHSQSSAKYSMYSCYSDWTSLRPRQCPAEPPGIYTPAGSPLSWGKFVKIPPQAKRARGKPCRSGVEDSGGIPQAGAEPWQGFPPSLGGGFDARGDPPKSMSTRLPSISIQFKGLSCLSSFSPHSLTCLTLDTR